MGDQPPITSRFSFSSPFPFSRRACPVGIGSWHRFFFSLLALNKPLLFSLFSLLALSDGPTPTPTTSRFSSPRGLALRCNVQCHRANAPPHRRCTTMLHRIKHQGARRPSSQGQAACRRAPCAERVCPIASLEAIQRPFFVWFRNYRRGSARREAACYRALAHR